MDRRIYEKRFAELSERLNSGDLDQDSFAKMLEDLSYQDESGNWHSIDEESGKWMAWDGTEWIFESGPYLEEDSAAIPPFGPLIREILKTAWQNFKRQLPLTFIVTLITGSIYFYFVIIRWGGYGEPGIPRGPFYSYELIFSKMLGVGDHGLSGFASGLSSAVLLGVGIPLLFGFIRNFFTKGPIKAVGEILSIPKQLGGYFHSSGDMALAGLASGAGVAMVVGSFMGSMANLMLAVGAGAMLSSRLGQVVSLLFRSFWAATFGMAQKNKVKQFSQAASYVALFGGSLAFMLRAILPPELSIFMGVGLLVLALFLAISSGTPSTAVPASFIGLFIGVGYLISSVNGFADDGGWSEVKQADKNALIHFIQWLMSEGGFEGFLNCLLPGLGAMFGPAFFTALNQALAGGAAAMPTGEIPPSDSSGGTSKGQQRSPQPDDNRKNEQQDPQMIDPDTGEPLVVQDGSYEGGEPGQVWYDGEWMDPKDAQRWINERKEQLRQREEENRAFWDDVEKDNAERRAQRERDLQAQGAKWDPDKQAWVGGAKDPGDPKLNEIYNRGDWIRENMSGLTPEQQAAAERILDRIGADETGVNPDDLSDKDMKDLRSLSQAINDLHTGKSEMEGANADRDAANALFGEQVAQATAQVGQMAANRVDPTGGIASNAIFGAAQNWDKGLKGAVKHGAVNAIGGWVDSKIGNMAPENVGLNAISGGATNGIQTWVLGGSKDEIKWAAGIGGLAGGMSAASNQLDRYLNDRKLPTIPAGDDPTLAMGSHGIGSNDDINVPDPGPPSMGGNRVTQSSTVSGGPRPTGIDADGGLIPPRAAAPDGPSAAPPPRGVGGTDDGMGVPSRSSVGDDPGMGTPLGDSDGVIGGGASRHGDTTETLGGSGTTGRDMDGGEGLTTSSQFGSGDPEGMGTPSRTDTDGPSTPPPGRDAGGSDDWTSSGHSDTEVSGTSGTTGRDSDGGEGVTSTSQPDSDGSEGMGSPSRTDADDSSVTTTQGQEPDGDGAYDMGSTPPTKEEQDELFNQLRSGDGDPPPKSDGGTDDGLAQQAEGYDHAQGGSSVEESRRNADESIWILRKNGEPEELLPTGAADYEPKPGEVLASKKRYDDTFNVKKRGPGMTDGEYNRLLEQHRGNLPEGRGYNPAPHAADADPNGVYDAGSRTPGQTDEEVDQLMQQMGGESGGSLPGRSSDGSTTPSADTQTPPSSVEGGATSPGSTPPKEQEIVNTIKKSVANDPKLQRAEAAAEKLLGGDDPDFDPDRKLPFTGKEWRAQDAASGGPREMPVPSGVDRSPEMQKLIDRESGRYPWLDGVDKRVRDAWAKVGGGTEPDAWAKFQKEVNPQDYERWHQVRFEGGIKQTEMSSAPTNAGSPRADD